MLQLRRDIKLENSKITKADKIPDIERTWLRNEQCFMIYGKSFEFYKKWEGDQTEARILLNGVADINSEALFDNNSTTYIERQGGTDDKYEIIFNEPILIHAITLGTVLQHTRYAQICFELYADDLASTRPDFELCTGEEPEYEIITLMVPQDNPTMISSIRYYFKRDILYKLSSLAVYHRGNVFFTHTRNWIYDWFSSFRL